jgi:hypothetical protein
MSIISEYKLFHRKDNMVKLCIKRIVMIIVTVSVILVVIITITLMMIPIIIVINH